MKFLVIILSIIIFLKTLSYGVYEIKEKNKSGGITVIVLAVFALILPYLMVCLRGI